MATALCKPKSSKSEPKEAATCSYREALYHTMEAALAENQNAFIMGQGVDDFKGFFGSTLDLAKKYGSDRVFDTPLAEEGMTGIAIGAALNGLYPIYTHMRADFSLLTMNQVINLAAKYKYMFGGRFEVPMLIRLVIGRSWGQGAQHSQSPQSLFAHNPGLTVIMPASSQTILDSYPYIVNHHRGPVISIEHRLLYDLVFHVDGSAPTNPLSARKVREGKTLTILATSIMVLEAHRAADYLAKVSNIDCEVIDLHCVSHLDKELILESVRKTGKLIVADTSWQAYGVCAEICRIIAESDPSLLKAPVKTVGMAPAPCPTAKTLEDLYYPNLFTLTDTICELATGRKDHGISLPQESSMADVYKRFKGPF